MKIGLVPNVVINARDPAASTPYVPLGLLSLAGALDARHSVRIVDPSLRVKTGRLTFDQDFEVATAQLLAARGFDLVGFSTFSATWHHTLKIARELKRIAPSTVVVLGGPQATACDGELLEAFPVDFVVRGEGEETFAELVEALDIGHSPSGIAGLTLRSGGAVARGPERPLIEDLDQLPMPAFHLVSVRGHPKVPVEVGRGCPYGCTYCSTSRYWQRRVRRKSTGRVLEELLLLQQRWAAGGINFVDDTFTLQRARLLELCSALAERRFPLPWQCSTRVDAVDDEVLETMARSGCTSIFYGIESGSRRIQRSIRKGIQLDRVEEALRLTERHGIGVTASLMMGFPDETEEDLRQTIALRGRIQQLFPDRQAIRVHLLAPDIGTEMTEAHAARLAYDGFHSDGAGGDLAALDRDLILAHPRLFLACYHIEPLHLDRRFVVLVSCFLMAAQLVCTWSVLYASLCDGDPLLLIRRWIAFFEAEPLPPGVAADAPLLARAVASATVFFRQHFTKANGYPRPVRELFEHELQLMRQEGALVAGRIGETPLVRDYHYDPRETIELIRSDHLAIARQKRRFTRITYRPRSEGKRTRVRP